MTGQELYEKAKLDDPEYPWHAWEVLSASEQDGWNRKAAEEAPKKAAPPKDPAKDPKTDGKPETK